MAHPTYTDKSGTKLPSVTTVINRFDNKQALIYAANKVGREGKTLQEAWYSGALTIGTAVHRLIESGAEKLPNTKQLLTLGIDDGLADQVLASFSGYLEWREMTRLRPVAKEVSLVSQQHGFGGTFDACMIMRKRSLLDYKTSSGIFPGYKVQLAAYGILWEENFPSKKLAGGYHILRIDKETGGYEHWHEKNLDPEKELFLAYLAAYKIEAKYGKRLK